MRAVLPATLLIVCLAHGCSVQPRAIKADFYVAPDGNDAWSGRRPAPNAERTDGPLATLAGARDAVRRHIPDMHSDIVVMLRGGQYFIDRTISFGPADSGRNGHKVIYTHYTDEQPVLVGGREIKGWQKHDDHIYRAKLGPAWEFHQLFADNVRQTNARHPNEGYLIVEDVPNKRSTTQFIYKPGDVPDGPDWRNGQVYIWAGHDWFSNLLPIKNIDRPSRTISLTGPTLTPIIKGRNPRTRHRRYFIQAVKGALDAPGEFWRDPDTGELWYWPGTTPIESKQIVAPTVTRIVEIVGTSPDTPAHDIVFRGIDFTISKFTDEFVETRGTHGKMPWNEAANKEAALYLEHADRCAIEFCEISNAGYSGIGIVWHGQHNRIYGNHIRDCGFHGVLLSGYRADFGTKMDRNKHNQVTNNCIHHCGRLVGHGAGIYLWASGHNKLTHNRIHNTPRYGICMKGQRWAGRFPPNCPNETTTWENHWDFLHSRENLFAYNDIFRVSEDTEDNGFISFWGIGKGNVVDHNLLHDSHRSLGGLGMAVYLDDATDYTTVTNNIIYNIDGGDSLQPIFAKGVFNRIENNILTGTQRTRSIIASFSMAGERTDHHVYRRNIIYLVNDAPVYEFWNWTPDRVVECDYNLYHVAGGKVQMKGAPGGDSYENWRTLNNGKFDAHSICADPLFVNPANHDYRLKPESPALKLGFQPIDTSRMGLKDDFPLRFRKQQRCNK